MKDEAPLTRATMPRRAATPPKTYTACVLIIGNEILSGRVQDENVAFLAKGLNDVGIRLKEVRVIPDDADTIVGTVNEVRRAFDYVFTTGGIGPTHDDITAQCIADAFAVKLILHPEAKRLLEGHYPAGAVNEARMRMAHVPDGAVLLPNPISRAPGFRIDNVYVMAGVPQIMQATFTRAEPPPQGRRQGAEPLGELQPWRGSAGERVGRAAGALRRPRDRLLPLFPPRRFWRHAGRPRHRPDAAPRRDRGTESADPCARRRPARGRERGLAAITLCATRTWRNGRRSRLKICSSNEGEGSSPSVRTSGIAAINAIEDLTRRFCR
jgi:molybdenum cofactor synthesis domain-containing protein